MLLTPPCAVQVRACWKSTSHRILAHGRGAQRQPRVDARILSKACPAEQETDDRDPEYSLGLVKSVGNLNALPPALLHRNVSQGRCPPLSLPLSLPGGTPRTAS